MRIFTASVIIIDYYCGALPRDASLRAGTRSNTLAIRGTETTRSVQHGHKEHTGCRRQGPATGCALEGR